MLVNKNKVTGHKVYNYREKTALFFYKKIDKTLFI